jgi:hypothetical protein
MADEGFGSLQPASFQGYATCHMSQSPASQQRGQCERSLVMSSTEQPSADSAPYVQLFQKAHQKIVMLERLEEQFQQIITKRQELQDELRSIQSQLNEEFESRIKTAGESHMRPVVTISPETSSSSKRASRFAAQTIESIGERAVG